MSARAVDVRLYVCVAVRLNAETFLYMVNKCCSKLYSVLLCMFRFPFVLVRRKMLSTCINRILL